MIDGKSHQEVANIFGKVEKFVSFDQYTAYSWLAAIAGCNSIIHRDELSVNSGLVGMDGVAYGDDDLERAKETIPNLFKFFENKEIANKLVMDNFLNIVDKHFS